MIFGKQDAGFCLPFFAIRDIMKKSVFQVSGENAVAGLGKRFVFSTYFRKIGGKSHDSAYEITRSAW